MLERIIEFHGPSILMNDEEVKPVPAIKNLPDWFKNLPAEFDKNSYGYNGSTIKKCMPFLDAITSGYILKSHQDLQINFNFYNEEVKAQDINVSTGVSPPDNFINKQYLKGLAFDHGSNYHPTKQVGEEKCPFTKRNSNLPFVKFLNTWSVVTPPGYSVMYLPVINNEDPRFTPITGIVDTDDNYYTQSNFPVIIHQQGKFIIKRGTPIVTVFPFKREDWKMKIKEIDIKKYEKTKANYFLYLKEWYKRNFWKKKKWK
jgi:hypothetical protein